jgi:uncharacterized membrane protein YphA (DoxX/SURF4 family)
MRSLDKPEMHEKGTSKMSLSTRTNKLASALLLLKRDPLMTLKLLGYWVATVVFALQILVVAITELKGSNQVLQIRIHEGYPAYVLTLLGVWKLLGILALLVPRFPRLKEWAYAGFFFDLTGAVFSSIASGGAGDPTTTIGFPIVLLLLAMASWALRPSSRKLGTLFPWRQLA